MSSEESYRAILRYLTNEREPYAPGTEGNVKRKIRKAAACYVVRGGTLYYQRRQRHRKTFAELEVVLQPERRQGLIEAAHLGPGGTHHTRHQTWHDLSKTYWWRGERRRGGGLAGHGPPTRPACAVSGLGRLAPAAGVRLRRGRGSELHERAGDAKAAALPHRKEARQAGGGPSPGVGLQGASPGAGPAAEAGARPPWARLLRPLGKGGGPGPRLRPLLSALGGSPRPWAAVVSAPARIGPVGLGISGFHCPHFSDSATATFKKKKKRITQLLGVIVSRRLESHF